MGKRFMKLIW